MSFFAIVGDPREITRRHFRIQKAMKTWWTTQGNARENIFHADDPFFIRIEIQRARDARVCTIGADN